MKLRAKLSISFGVMLVLVACTTAIGWLAMRDMGKMAFQIAQVDNTLSSIQSAQVNLLRYIQNKDPQYQESAKAYLQKATDFMNVAQSSISHAAQRATSVKIHQEIKDFHQSLTDLLEHMNKSVKIGKDMDILNADLAAVSTKTLATLETNIKKDYQEYRFTAFSKMNQADSAFYSARGAVLVYATEPSKENLDTAYKSLAEARKLCAESAALLHVPADKEAVQHMVVALDAYTARVQEYVDSQKQVDVQFAQARTIVRTLVEHCNGMSNAAFTLMEDNRATGTTMNISALAIALLIGMGITVLLTRNVLRQLGKDPGELATIATRVTEGDYNIDDGSPLHGVYGNIVAMVAALKEHIDNAQKATTEAQAQSAKAVEAMQAADAASKDAQAKRDSILKAADKLDEVSQVVSSAAEELSAQIEQSERGAAEQASRASETATAMEEMNSTVLEVARNASSANDGGKAMRTKALEGAEIVESSVREVQKARSDALTLKDDMNTLSEQAQSIGQIMNVISDIADQTNLLALNAAIEAARAGEAGRGFAVVADEVRKLAEKTMKSTTDVGNAIKSIQGSAAKNMAQVDATVKNIETSSEQAEKSGQALREIVAMIDTSVAQISSIATASEQQSATSEEINRSVAQVNTIAGETARAMQEAAQAVSDLSGQAQVLTRLIEDMKKD